MPSEPRTVLIVCHHGFVADALVEALAAAQFETKLVIKPWGSSLEGYRFDDMFVRFPTSDDLAGVVETPASKAAREDWIGRLPTYLRPGGRFYDL